MQAALATGLRRLIELDPSNNYVALDIMDGYSIPCPADMSAVHEAGSFSGPAISAVSAIAAELAHDFPDLKIEAIAYHKAGTEVPPTRGHLYRDGLHPNVVIMYCMTGEDNALGLDAQQNNDTLANLRGWLATKLEFWTKY